MKTTTEKKGKMNNEQKILEILSRLDTRMTAIEGGAVAKWQKTETPKPLSVSEQICQRVRADLKTKEIILLSDYAKGGELKWSRLILKKDKSVKVVIEGKRVFVMKAHPLAEPKQKEDKPVVVIREKQHYTKHRTRHPKQQGTEARMEIVKKYLAKGKSITRRKIEKVCGCSHGTARIVMLAFQNERGYTLRKIGSGKTSRLILSEKGYEAKHQPPMLRKSEYTTFIANTLRQLRKEGMSNADAWRIGTAKWNEIKAQRKGSIPPSATPQTTPQSQFPTFRSIKSEYQPILAGVLDKLVKRGVAVDYRGVAYALDISTEAEYKALIEEIIQKWEQIKTYFGVSGDLKWDGKSLRMSQ